MKPVFNISMLVSCFRSFCCFVVVVVVVVVAVLVLVFFLMKLKCYVFHFFLLGRRS